MDITDNTIDVPLKDFKEPFYFDRPKNETIFKEFVLSKYNIK